MYHAFAILGVQSMARDGRVGGEGCYVRRILGRREGYVQKLYRIRERVSAMARAWGRIGLGQQLKA